MSALVWYHDDYLVNLPEQPPEVIQAAFKGALQDAEFLLAGGPVRDDEQIADLRHYVMTENNLAAREARRSGGAWVRLRLTLWRGCWCLWGYRRGRALYGRLSRAYPWNVTFEPAPRPAELPLPPLSLAHVLDRPISRPATPPTPTIRRPV